MKTFDLKKLEKSIIYMERIENGRNPFNNSVLKSDDSLNDSNIVRCMSFIKEVLKEVHACHGAVGQQGDAFSCFPAYLIEQYHYAEDKSIAHILAQLYEPENNQNVKKISAAKMASILKDEGYLEEVVNPETGKPMKVPTEKGKQAGLYLRKRDYNGQSYLATLYNEQAQNLVLELIKKRIHHD